MSKASRYSLLAIVVVGFLARAPGVFWGDNFPMGWYGHHVDEYTHLVNAEMMINPALPPRWPPNPYPKGMAAHVAVPMGAARLLSGTLYAPLPSVQSIIVLGRAVSVFYGVATILALFLLGRRLFRDHRVALAAALLFALGGLHVSQSHFFVSGVASLFWFTLGQLVLLLELDERDGRDTWHLTLASLFFGFAFGLKFAVFALPSLGFITLMRPPRALRVLQVAGFFTLGIVVVNFGFFSAYDLFEALIRGTNDPYQFSWHTSFLLYIIEMPSIVGFPILAFGIYGIVALSRAFAAAPRAKQRDVTLVVLVPTVVTLLFILFQFDHFPRHWIPLIPWLCVCAGWSLVRSGDWLRNRGLSPAFLYVPVVLYLAVFVYDGERGYINEPRNDAANWLLDNVATGSRIAWQYHGWLTDYDVQPFPEQRPPVLVVEMHAANHYLSGMWFRDSYPTDYRYIFDSLSQEQVDELQAVFKGESEYSEVARFSEVYFMPEYVFSDYLIGNRSRNYLAEIVVFMAPEGEG